MQGYLHELDLILSNLFVKYEAAEIIPGVLLSGGIDSSTIAYLVAKTFSPYRIFSMGTGRSQDKPFVDIMTGFLQHDYEWVELTEKDIGLQIGKVIELLKQASVPQTLMQVSLAIGYYLVFRAAHDKGVTHIFTGQGPDILFAGYHKYKAVADINDEIEKDRPLLDIDKRRDQAMASHFGITLINPYLEDEFVRFSLRVPSHYKLKEGIEKYLLRKYAESKGIPKAITGRPKKAFQYSTGLQKIVSKHYLPKL